MNTTFNSIAVILALAGTATCGVAGADTNGNERKEPHPRDHQESMANNDDAAVTAAIRSKLAGGRDAGDLTAHVEARGGRVTLLGTAHDAAASRRAVRMAQTIPGVVYVDNQLIVTDMKPYRDEIGPLKPLAFTEPTAAEMTAGIVPPTHIATPGPYGTGTWTSAPMARTRMGARPFRALSANPLGGPEIPAVRCENASPAVPGPGLDETVVR